MSLFWTFQVTIGRGLDVTYQLLSTSCPLMISRLHCTFKQREDGNWTVTDKKVARGLMWAIINDTFVINLFVNVKDLYKENK